MFSIKFLTPGMILDLFKWRKFKYGRESGKNRQISKIATKFPHLAPRPPKSPNFLRLRCTWKDHHSFIPKFSQSSWLGGGQVLNNPVYQTEEQDNLHERVLLYVLTDVWQESVVFSLTEIAHCPDF